MAGRGDVYIDGERLREIRDAKLLTQDDFAAEIGVARTWVQAAEASRRKRVLRSKVARIATALKIDPQKLLAPEPTEPQLTNTNVGPEQLLAPIPTFDLPLSASRWSVIEGMPEVTDPRSIEQGLIRVRITGKCMEPVYQSGQLIEFKILQLGRDEIRIGLDVYVQKSDGLATFKRVASMDDERLTLAPINPEFKERLWVVWDEISRIAEAVAFVNLIKK